MVAVAEAGQVAVVVDPVAVVVQVVASAGQAQAIGTNLSLGAQAQNVFNYHAYGVPVGTLTSNNFGRSLQLAGGPYTSNAATERLQVFLSFNF